MPQDNPIIIEALARFREAEEAEHENREAAANDLRMLAGGLGQWDPEDVRARTAGPYKRPCITVNKLRGPVFSIVNEGRQNRPGPKVSAVSGGADEDVAEVAEGMLRHIDYASGADAAYDTGYEYAVSSSFGAWRYTTEYVRGSVDKKEIRVVRIADPSGVYFDPYCQEVDCSDAGYAFVRRRISAKDFEKKYPKAQAVSVAFGDDSADAFWFDKDGLILAEYWRVEKKKRKLQEWSDGVTRYEDDKKAHKDKPKGATVVDEREEDVPTIKMYLINGVEVLEESEWPGRWIPIVPVWGPELYVGGRRMVFSAIRDALDPQKMLNYAETINAETMALAPRPKWVGWIGQFKSKFQDWISANTSNKPFLEVDVPSDPLAPKEFPHYQTFEPPTQSLNMAAERASQNIQALTGVYDESLGKARGDQSGRAISALQKAGDIGNYHYSDNFIRALKHGYSIVLDLIPKIYDTEREERIIGADGVGKVIKVNQPFIDPKTGQIKTLMLDAGDYDVTVSVGPNYDSQREQAKDFANLLVKEAPQIMPQVIDLLIKLQHLGPIGDQMAERLTAPQYRKDGQQDPAAMAQQFQQMQVAHQQLLQVAQEQKQKLDTDAVKMQGQMQIKQMELQSEERQKAAALASTERIAAVRAQLEGAAIGVDFNKYTASLEAKRATDQANMIFNQAHEVGTQAQDHANALQATAMDQAHQQQMAEADRTHQAGMAEQAQQAQQEMAAQQPQGEA